LICVSALSALSMKVILATRPRRNLVNAFRVRGSLAPKPSGGRRHAKLEPHRAFLLEKVAEKADITMPELAAELAAATCEKADPASLSRWLIRIGYRFKKNSAGQRA
jgi:transposase